MQASVIWFNNAKGYGFLRPEGSDKDIFVHFSDIEMTGYKTLEEGAKVEFELGTCEKGQKACKVRVV